MIDQEITVNGKTFIVNQELADQVEALFVERKVMPEKINEIDAGIVALLEELKTADWHTLIPDDHTATLIALGLFLDYYENVHEGASVLTDEKYTVEYFADRQWCIGGDAETWLAIIREGEHLD